MSSKYMLSPLGDYLFEKIGKHQEFSEKDQLLIELGIETSLIAIPKIILIGTMAFAFGILPQVMIYSVAFLILRLFAYGRHLKSDFWCTIFTALLFVGIPAIMVRLSIQLTLPWRLWVSIMMAGLIILLAPADTVKNRIVSRKLRRKLRIEASLVVIIICFLQVVLHDQIGTLLVLSMCSVVQLLLPETKKEGFEKNEK